jgi:hypothetical protein
VWAPRGGLHTASGAGWASGGAPPPRPPAHTRTDHQVSQRERTLGGLDVVIHAYVGGFPLVSLTPLGLFDIESCGPSVSASYNLRSRVGVWCSTSATSTFAHTYRSSGFALALSASFSVIDVVIHALLVGFALAFSEVSRFCWVLSRVGPSGVLNSASEQSGRLLQQPRRVHLRPHVQIIWLRKERELSVA